MTPINNGTLPNDGTGLKLRDAFTLVNDNYIDTQSQIDGKANVIHTHEIEDINDLSTQLSDIKDNIISLQSEVSSKSDFNDTQLQINDLQDIITGLNTMIQQQNSEINDLNELINEIIQNMNN